MNRIKGGMAEHNETGKRGEELAAGFLQKKGLKIRETNWRLFRYEVDLIAEEKGVLVIVEVKTRTSATVAAPETAVTKEKQRHLIAAANAYIRLKGLNLEVRFDIISIVIAGENHQLTYIPDAFYALVR